MLELKGQVSKERKQPDLIELCRDAYADFEVERNKRSRLVRSKDGKVVGPVEENWDSTDDEDDNDGGVVDENMFAASGTSGSRRRLVPGKNGREKSRKRDDAGSSEDEGESISSS